MAKNSVYDWDATAANNTDVGGVGITGNSLPSNLDDGMRTLMAQIKSWSTSLGLSSGDQVAKLGSVNTFTATQIFAGAGANGETVLELRSERPWLIRQRGTGAGAELSFENVTSKQIGFSNDAVWSQSNIVLDPQAANPSISIGGRQAYHRGNILAAVAVSGGFPTGGIIERGSNANGQYTRYADGTQIVAGSVSIATTDVPAAGTYTFPFTYPAAFAGAPVLAGAFGVANTASTAFTNMVKWATDRFNPVSANNLHIQFSGSINNTATFTYSVVGRWF